MRMPFGCFDNCDLDDVPIEYLHHLMQRVDLREWPGLEAEVYEAYWRRVVAEERRELERLARARKDT